mmetsp:Transcript_27237/g.37406  ORF Transcript_27237/g.37406 Transcript_27237/m.37406 type:complete len:439 (-) Transcript_27237:94-1410(-)
MNSENPAEDFNEFTALTERVDNCSKNLHATRECIRVIRTRLRDQRGTNQETPLVVSKELLPGEQRLSNQTQKSRSIEVEETETPLQLTLGQTTSLEDKQDVVSDAMHFHTMRSSVEMSVSERHALDRGIRAFNINPMRGIRYILTESGLAEDLPALGIFLAQVHGLNKNKLGEWLGEHHEEAVTTLGFFSQNFHFAGMAFGPALRRFLSRFKLPGDSQKIDRITFSFSKAYHEKNPDAFSSVDVVHILSFSAILLNADAHKPGIKHRMTLEEFVSNNRGIDNGRNIRREILEELYTGIVKNEILTNEDRDDQGNLFTDPVKEGWLRKQGGFDKGWSKRWFILCENTLFYFKDEKDIDPRGFFPLSDDVEAIICESNDKHFELLPKLGLQSSLKSAKYDQHKELVIRHDKKCALRAASTEDAKEWADSINEVGMQHTRM